MGGGQRAAVACVQHGRSGRHSMHAVLATNRTSLRCSCAAVMAYEAGGDDGTRQVRLQTLLRTGQAAEGTVKYVIAE